MEVDSEGDKRQTLPLIPILWVTLGISLIAAFLVIRWSGEREEAATQAREAATQAVEAVAAVDSAVSAGVIHADYVRRVADAKVALDRYANSGKADSSITQLLAGALEDFGAAEKVWAHEIDGYKVLYKEPWDGLAWEADLFSRYDLRSPAEKGLDELEPSVSHALGKILSKDALNIIWSSASSKIKRARESIR